MVRCGWFVKFSTRLLILVYAKRSLYPKAKKISPQSTQGMMVCTFCDEFSSGLTEMEMNWCPLLITLWRHRHYKRMPTKKEPATGMSRKLGVQALR